jgi:peptidoglycan/xylan/chitin deacetylase (PgdA/CDA1 family)
MATSVSDSALRGICFHGIGRPQRSLEPAEGRYWIQVDSFHEMLDLVEERPDVRISFDDGNASDLDIGLPALVDRGLVASFFVLAGRIGSRGSLDADGLRELNRHGMTIGTHGMDHRPWRGLSPGERDRELIEARDQIAHVVGRPVDQAAVPMGLYDRRLLVDLKQLGYSAVHTSERMSGTEGAWLRPRFSILADDTVQTVQRDVLTDPPRVRRAWLVAKSGMKRLR